MTVPASGQRYVGVDLDKNGNEVVEAILQAVQEENPDVVVQDMLTYYKIKSPGTLQISRARVEEHLGRDWDLSQLQIYMSSYFGFIEEWDEEQMIIRWHEA